MINFSELLRFDYLIVRDLPTFEFREELSIFLGIGIILAVIALSYASRPREKLMKLKRFALRKAAKLHLGLSLGLGLLLIFRIYNVSVLNMRILSLLVLVAMFLNAIYLLFVFVKISRSKSEISKTSTESEYQKYLPKKKKRK